MDQILLKRIIEIINSKQPRETIQTELSKLKTEEDPNEAQFLLLLRDIIDEYALPFNGKEKLHFWRHEDILDDEYEAIKYIHNETNNPYFLAISGEILWDYYHQRAYADNAVKAYLECLEMAETRIEFNQFALGICRIISKYKPDFFDFEVFCEKCKSHIKANYHDGFTALFLMQGIARIKRGFVEVEGIWCEIIDALNDAGNYSNAIKFAEKIVEEYKVQNKKSQVKELKKRIALMYEEQANTLDWENPQDAHKIIHLIQNAIVAWDLSGEDPTRAEQKRLAQRIEPVKELQLKSLSVIKSDPIDISEFIAYVEKLVNTQDLKSVLIHLINLIPLRSRDDLLKSIQENFSLVDLVPLHVLTGTGRTKCIVPAKDRATQEEMESILEHKAYENQTMIAGDLVLRFLQIWNDKVDLTEADFRFIVENNAFIPEDRKESFLKGLYAGVKMDYITAMSILMPQVENAVRRFAEKVGIVTFYPDKQGVDRCYSMSTLLDMPEFKEYFDEDLIFYLKVHYTSSYGFGMRDDVAHGLLSDGALNSKVSAMVWWYTLRLCVTYCPEFYTRV